MGKEGDNNGNSAYTKASQRKRILEALNSTPNALCVVNSRLQVLSYNDMFKVYVKKFNQESKSITKDLILKKDFASIMPCFNKHLSSIKDVFNQKREFIVDEWVSIGNQKLFIKLIARLLIINDEFAVAIYLVDKTESQNDKIEKEKLMKEKIQELKNKDIFFKTLAHDLKSPFNAILGYLDYLDNDDLDDKKFIKETLLIIKSAAKNHFNSLNELFEWYNILSGLIKSNPERLNLSTIINNVFRNNRLSAEKKDIKMILDIDINTVIFADSHMIHSIMHNLVSNAIKFSNANADSRIVVSENMNDGYVEISVKDSGIGMSKEILENLFVLGETRFGTSKEKGTGFGLVNSKALIELNGGKVSVESKEGKGSTFKFTIPLAT